MIHEGLTDGVESEPILKDHEAGSEVVRGISLTTLMMCGCCVLAGKDDEAQHWYSRSKPVERLEYFLSHSWQDGRFSKALGLTLHISRMSAIWVSCLIVFVVACLQFFDVVPLPSYSFKLMDDRSSTNGVSCLILGCSAWGLFLALAPLLRPSEMWFLDKACICQADAELKQKGIRALRAFLERSSAMVILLTPNYFLRGWCTFEIASFMASQGIHAVQIVPLSRSALVVCAFGISLSAASVCHISILFGLSQAQILGQYKIFGIQAGELLALGAPSGLVFGIAYFIVEHYVSQKQVIVDQVRNFSMARAEFTQDTDRIFVTKVIESLFGTVSRFEAAVHTTVYKKVEAQLGSDRWLSIPYDAVVLGALPCFWWCVDMFCTDPREIKYIDFFNGTTLTFMFLPLFFAMLGVWAKVKLRLTGGTPACVQHLASAVASLFACVMGVVGWTFILRVYIYEQFHIGLIQWVGFIVLTVATFAKWPQMRHAPLQQDGNGGRLAEEVEAPMLPKS